MITEQLKDFLQNNKILDLLNLGQIDKVLQRCPVDLRPQLNKMLADSDITLQDSGDSMNGIQTAQTKNIFRDTYKLTVKSPNRKSNPLAYGVSLVKSNGVQSGSLVAFKSLHDAYNFIKLMGEEGDLSPFKLGSANSYSWVEVPYRENPNVKFWITTSIRDYYDLDKRKYQKQLQNAYQKLNQEFQTMMRTKYFSEEDLEKYLQDELYNTNMYSYIGVYLHVAYGGYYIHVSEYNQDISQDPLRDIRGKVDEFLKQHKINSNELILKVVGDKIILEPNNNTQLLNDLANQLNNKFGVDLQQGYPEIFS